MEIVSSRLPANALTLVLTKKVRLPQDNILQLLIGLLSFTGNL